MLQDSYESKLTPLDELVFEKLVPADHYLRKLKESLDFTPCRKLVEKCYSPDQGRPAEDPVLMIKLCLLERQYGLSDSGTIKTAQCHAAWRYFLDLSLDDELPVPSLLTYFRKRLGAENFEKIFQEIVRQAREMGLVKDRLRLKDATHLIADIHIPSILGLLAQIRDALLKSARGFAPAEVAERERQILALREATADQPETHRLQRRIEYLRELVTWAAGWQERLEWGAPPISPEEYDRFVENLRLARKILADREEEATDRLLSLIDPDARRGFHVGYFEGYQVDVSMDADSEIICAMEALPVHESEAMHAVELIQKEEKAQQNNVEALSTDAAGFHGEALEALMDDPEGPQLIVYVPPIDQPPTGLYQPEDFTLNEAGDTLNCPGGQSTRTRTRAKGKHGWEYEFKASQCRGCALREKCLKPGKVENRRGRTVTKNDYAAQYKAARERATTKEYRQIRKEHPAIERKLNELVRWHDGRRVRYRGLARVKSEYLILGIVVNCKRIVRLLTAAPAPQPV